MAENQEQSAGGTNGKPARSRRRVLTGVVTRDKMNKTRRVEIKRLVRHPMYGKYVKHRTVCYVHDENNESSNGDTVEIMETRHLSKTKCWRLVRVVTKAPGGRGAVSEEERREAMRAIEAERAEKEAAKRAAAEADRAGEVTDGEGGGEA